ncbi:Uncharacterised protein g4819 [Pycnogonum litorale]
MPKSKKEPKSRKKRNQPILLHCLIHCLNEHLIENLEWMEQMEWNGTNDSFTFPYVRISDHVDKSQCKLFVVWASLSKNIPQQLSNLNLQKLKRNVRCSLNKYLSNHELVKCETVGKAHASYKILKIHDVIYDMKMRSYDYSSVATLCDLFDAMLRDENSGQRSNAANTPQQTEVGEFLEDYSAYDNDLKFNLNPSSSTSEFQESGNDENVIEDADSVPDLFGQLFDVEDQEQQTGAGLINENLTNDGGMLDKSPMLSSSPILQELEVYDATEFLFDPVQKDKGLKELSKVPVILDMDMDSNICGFFEKYQLIDFNFNENGVKMGGLPQETSQGDNSTAG